MRLNLGAQHADLYALSWRRSLGQIRASARGAATASAVLLLGFLAGCADRAVLVPNDWLRTWTIQAESVQVEAAAPSRERVQLREATLQFPILSGTIESVESVWQTRLPGLQVTFPVAYRELVASLPPPPVPAGDPASAAAFTKRMRVSGVGPFNGQIDLHDAYLTGLQVTGIVESVNPGWSGQAASRKINLDVRQLDKVWVYRGNSRGGEVLGAGLLVTLIVVPTMLVVVLTVALIAGCSKSGAFCFGTPVY